MSLHEYRSCQEIGKRHYPFYALIMAAMRQADTDNAFRLRCVFPEVWDELQERYDAPGAHKDISEIMKAQEDLVEIVVELTPLGVLKG